MNAPPSAPRRMRSSPSSWSERYASRTDPRLVLNCRAMSRSAGSLWPADRRPSEICFLMRRAMISDTRPGRPEVPRIESMAPGSCGAIGVADAAAGDWRLRGTVVWARRSSPVPVYLENELQAQLDLPRRRGRRGDLAGLRIAGAAGVEDEEIRQPEVHDVERVERLEPELHRVAPDPLVLEQGQVRHLQPGAAQRVAARVAE